VSSKNRPTLACIVLVAIYSTVLLYLHVWHMYGAIFVLHGVLYLLNSPSYVRVYSMLFPGKLVAPTFYNIFFSEGYWEGANCSIRRRSKLLKTGAVCPCVTAPYSIWTRVETKIVVFAFLRTFSRRFYFRFRERKLTKMQNLLVLPHFNFLTTFLSIILF
jgi:hypothetical protein